MRPLNSPQAACFAASAPALRQAGRGAEALVLVMTSVTSFVSYHYFAHIPDPGKPEKRRSGAPANAQQLESSVQRLMIITRNLLADPQLQQFCHTEDPDYFQREEAAELLHICQFQDLLHSALDSA